MQIFLCFADKSDVSDDFIHRMRMLFGACFNELSNLSKDCIWSIHLLENKSNLRRLLQTKLVFSLEQTILFAKSIYDSEFLEQNGDRSPFYYTMFKHCTKCIQTVLSDSNIQVYSSFVCNI